MRKFNLNGLTVRRRGATIFIPLPRDLWRSCGGCCCRYCSDTARKNNPEAYWDTLAVSAMAPTRDVPHTDHTWMVHAPEYHGAKPKRGT